MLREVAAGTRPVIVVDREVDVASEAPPTASGCVGGSGYSEPSLVMARMPGQLVSEESSKRQPLTILSVRRASEAGKDSLGAAPALLTPQPIL